MLWWVSAGEPQLQQRRDSFASPCCSKSGVVYNSQVFLPLTFPAILFVKYEGVSTIWSGQPTFTTSTAEPVRFKGSSATSKVSVTLDQAAS